MKKLQLSKEVIKSLNVRTGMQTGAKESPPPIIVFPPEPVTPWTKGGCPVPTLKFP